MDELRKRSFDAGDQSISKRFRPEEILGGNSDDPTKVMTRLLLTKMQFSRVIGKGGQTVTYIRTSTGVNVRGCDLDDEYRLVLISGSLPQVLRGFDMITDLIFPNMVGTPPAAPTEVAVVSILLEHSKAGRAVGTKGSMLQSMTQRSGAVNVRVDKEPMDLAGITLRRLSMEGSLLSIRRVHYLVLELFVDTAAAFAAAAQSLTTEDVQAPNNFMQQQLSVPPLPQLQQRLYGPVGGSYGDKLMPAVTSRFPTPTVAVQPTLYQVPSPITIHQTAGYGATNPPPGYQTAGFNNINGPRLGQNAVGFPSSSDPSSTLKSYLVTSYNTIPFAVLGNFGVGNDVLRQLMELKATLNSNFGFELLVSTQAPDKTDTGSELSPDRIIAARKLSHPNELCFAIPVSAVGGVIGKGGSTLKELQTEFSVKVFIQKEEYQGKRIVMLRYNGPEVAGERGDADASSVNRLNGRPVHNKPAATAAEPALLQCKERILAMIVADVTHQKAAAL